MQKHQGGFLTIFSAEGGEIYGELADASWSEEAAPGGGVNHIFTGLASDGTAETFAKLNMNGIEHVNYRFESESSTVSGQARLLASEKASAPARALIRIESLTEPA